MRKLLSGIALLALLPPLAVAADLPVKAPQSQASPFVTANGSGFYWGIGTTSKVADSTVNGNVFAGNLISSNVMAAGQTVDGEVGYIWGNASVAGFANWWRLYASASYQNISGGVSVPSNSASVASRWAAQQGFDVNADVVQMIFTTFGWTNPFAGFQPQLPSNIAVAASPRQYIGGFVTEVGLTGNFGQASGTSWAVAGGARTGFLWQMLGANGKPNGMAFDSGVQVSWMPKGVTFNNVFAGNGAPLAVNSSVNMGTTYALYARLDF